MKYSICIAAAAPVRKEPGHRSEMINQLLFGETMQVLEEKDEWLRIRSLYDDYEGWLTYHMIAPVDEKVIAATSPFVTSLLTNPVTTADQLINAPMGAPLTGYDEETRLLWDPQYKYHGTFRDTRKGFDSEVMKKTIQQWLNAPYLWGGKTFMGVDCSGFVQTVFKLLGIKLKRDAWQQQEQGELIAGVANAKEGDLAFFQNGNGRVTHVGIVLENNRIAHSSGKVRIDKLDEEGIVNVQSGIRTHHVHSVKRYF